MVFQLFEKPSEKSQMETFQGGRRPLDTASWRFARFKAFASLGAAAAQTLLMRVGQRGGRADRKWVKNTDLGVLLIFHPALWITTCSFEGFVSLHIKLYIYIYT